MIVGKKTRKEGYYMLVRRCDRCGAEKTDDGDLFYGMTIARTDGTPINIDLCRKCGDKVMDLIRGGDEPNPEV